MKLVAQTAPFIRKPVSVRRMMVDVLIALLPVVLFACIQNGWNGIYVFLISIGTMLITEWVAHALIAWPKGMKRRELFSKEGYKGRGYVYRQQCDGSAYFSHYFCVVDAFWQQLVYCIHRCFVRNVGRKNDFRRLGQQYI